MSVWMYQTTIKCGIFWWPRPPHTYGHDCFRIAVTYLFLLALTDSCNALSSMVTGGVRYFFSLVFTSAQLTLVTKYRSLSFRQSHIKIWHAATSAGRNAKHAFGVFLVLSHFLGALASVDCSTSVTINCLQPSSLSYLLEKASHRAPPS